MESIEKLPRDEVERLRKNLKAILAISTYQEGPYDDNGKLRSENVKED